MNGLRSYGLAGLLCRDPPRRDEGDRPPCPVLFEEMARSFTFLLPLPKACWSRDLPRLRSVSVLSDSSAELDSDSEPEDPA